MRETRQNKDIVIGLRLTSEIKKALDKAAADDDRTGASLAMKMIREGLIARGYLTAPEPKAMD